MAEQAEANPFISRTGRRLYDELLGRRQQKLDLADKVIECAEAERQGTSVAEQEPCASRPEPAVDTPAIEEQALQPEQPKNNNVLHFPPRQDFSSGATLGDLLTWYQCKQEDAVCGQEKALIKATLKAIMLNSFTLEAPAGRGKTYILKSLASVLPEDVAYWFEFGTEASIFNNAEEINKYKILILPEYQKMLKGAPQIKEIIKTITEGRVAKRQKTGDDGNIVQQYINPKCVITSIADENEFKENLAKDKEDMRRFSHIRLDTSIDATMKIRDYKCKRRSNLPAMLKTAPEALGRRIKNHLSDCIKLQLEESPLDPFAEFMNQYIPMTDKSIAYVDDYYSYLDGCAKFHHKDRMLQCGRQEILVLDLADHHTVYQIYHEEFCKTLLMLDNLEDFGDRVQKARETVDWKACFEAGLAQMRKNVPGIVADKWAARQLKDNKLIVTDPVTQEEKVLFEYAG